LPSKFYAGTFASIYSYPQSRYPKNAQISHATDEYTQPRTAKPKEKPYKLSDGGGLYLLVNPDRSKYWRMGYRFEGTERLLAFGKYPEISLADARKARMAAREKINAGIDPAQAKRISYLAVLNQALLPAFIQAFKRLHVESELDGSFCRTKSLSACA
jgi:hypothetical protein